MKFSLIVPESGESPESPAPRLDLLILKALRNAHPTLTRNSVKELFQEERVLINGRKARASGILPGGRYEVEVREEGARALAAAELPAPPSPQGCFLPVIYEDENLLVLHKETSVPSVPHSSEELSTAVNAALARVPGLRDAHPASLLEPGLLHRLDTGTSGLLIFAKTAGEFQRLKDLWKTRSIRKFYRALCCGTESLPPTPFTLDLQLGHSARSKKRMIAIGKERAEIRGKALRAITHVRAIRALQNPPFGSSLVGNAAEFELEIETGVQHQIRCTLAAQGWPIAGDSLYGGIPSSRLWLHAEGLELPLAHGPVLRLHAQMPQHWPAL